MKQILADITPVGSNNLFVTHYWPDKQTDPPLHYHEDYMLCLTLHVRGQRIMDDAVEDFTEKDLVLINPGTPHRFKRDAAYADAKCETATVMFSREMPDWKFLSLEHMRPIREMLLRPAAGLRFAPKTIDTVLERMISLPKLDGFEAVSLFFSILNDLATAPPDEVQQIGSRHDGSYQDDRVRRIVRFVEESYSRKLSLEEIGRSVDMSPSSVCRYFKRRTHQNLWEYINSFRINRAAQLIVETQLPISEIGPRCGFTNVSNFNHLFRAHLGTTPSDYRSGSKPRRSRRIRRTEKRRPLHPETPLFHDTCGSTHFDLPGRVHQDALLVQGLAHGVVLFHHQSQFRAGERLADTHVQRRDDRSETRRLLLHFDDPVAVAQFRLVYGQRNGRF